MADGAVYEYQPSFILGFHGCPKPVGEAILHGREPHLKPSEKEWDWLGRGIYFWEGNLARAWEWAHDRKAEGKIDEPYVVGAIIDLRHCLDLFDREAMRQVSATYATLQAAFASAAKVLPKNTGKTPDRAGSKQMPYDSVRGPFLEGDPIYDGAGFRSHSHIQICIRNTACIKGYFRPIQPS